MKLRVIIRNLVPFITLQEPVKHRSVLVELTEEQVKQIGLREVAKDHKGNKIFEQISHCFIEEEANELET